MKKAKVILSNPALPNMKKKKKTDMEKTQTDNEKTYKYEGTSQSSDPISCDFKRADDVVKQRY